MSFNGTVDDHLFREAAVMSAITVTMVTVVAIAATVWYCCYRLLSWRSG